MRYCRSGRLVSPSAQLKDIRLQKVLDPLAGPVSGDPNRLQQIIWNLLSNAIKFTPKGGKIEVLLDRVNSHVEITVRIRDKASSRTFSRTCSIGFGKPTHRPHVNRGVWD